jgi:hypothetical protein
MRYEDRQDRERRVDALEREMEELRDQIQRTLDGMEGRGQRRKILGRVRSSLPNLPRRTPAQSTKTHEDTPETPKGRGSTATPPDAGNGPQGPTEHLSDTREVPGRGRSSWWRRIIGG